MFLVSSVVGVVLVRPTLLPDLARVLLGSCSKLENRGVDSDVSTSHSRRVKPSRMGLRVRGFGLVKDV